MPLVISLLAFLVGFFYESLTESLSGEYSGFARGLLLALLSFVFVANYQLIAETFMFLKRSEVKDSVDLKSKIDKKFLMIFDEYFDTVLDNIKSAITSEKMVIYDPVQHRDFYKRVLTLYPNATFYATSMVSKNYFWEETEKSGSFEEAIKVFINAGGKVERIFYIDEENPEEVDMKEKLLPLHRDMGVKTYSLDVNKIHANDFRLITMADNKKIAWEIFLGQNNSIRKIEITINKFKIEELNKAFHKLKGMDVLHAY